MLAALLAAASLGLPVLELELAGGAAHPLAPPDATSDLDCADSCYDYPLASPVVEARIAVDARDTIALAATALAVVGSQGLDGFSATAVLGFSLEPTTYGMSASGPAALLGWHRPGSLAVMSR